MVVLETPDRSRMASIVVAASPPSAMRAAVAPRTARRVRLFREGTDPAADEIVPTTAA
jgi:hypothetical protein